MSSEKTEFSSQVWGLTCRLTKRKKGARQDCPILTHFLQKAIKDSQSRTSSCKKSNVVSYLNLKFYIQYTLAFINFVCNRGRCQKLQCVIYHIPQPIRLSHTQALDLLTITVSPYPRLPRSKTKIYPICLMHFWGICLALQWLRLNACNARGTGLMAGWGTKFPHAMHHSQENIFF